MTEEPINYHRHIEQAIQNVLSKVKKRSPSPSSDETVSPTLPFESAAEKAIDDATAEDLSTMQPSPTSSPSPPQNALQPLTEEVHYLEADDLYTPMLLEDINTPDTEEEPPLIADTYSAPYNIFEEFVETELNIMLSRYIDLCRCSQCRADIVAIALNQLPAYYVTGTRGTLTAKSVIWAKYTQQIVDAVTKAINIVYKRPRNNCKKIKQMIWVKPDLEEVQKEPSSHTNTTGTLFQQIHTEDIELSFSNEVEEIIQILEQEDSDDKASLLPVSSPYVHQQKTVPSPGLESLEIVTASSHDQAVKNSNQIEEVAPKMELIEDWD